jgi:L-ascorbate metabolism protein UlaG (beta-lactamase superfamily)
MTRYVHKALLGATLALMAGSPSAQAADNAMKLKSLGINGFEFKTGGETLLIDPYVSRDHRRVSIPEVVRKHIKQADYIVLTHSHWDHLADVPEIAKYTDAVICGSETTLNICRYFKIAESRLRLYENHRTIQLGKFMLTPIRSKHKEPVGYPGRYDEVPAMLDGVADYVEGGTWALLVTAAGRTFLNVGSANLIDKELQAIECDYLLASIAGRAPDYLPRLFECVEAKVFVPTHWDNFFGHPVEEPGERVSLAEFGREMKRVAPEQEVRSLRPLEAFDLSER